VVQNINDNDIHYEPLSLPTNTISKDHAPLYQLQLGRYVQLWSWADS